LNHKIPCVCVCLATVNKWHKKREFVIQSKSGAREKLRIEFRSKFRSKFRSTLRSKSRSKLKLRVEN